MNRKVLVCKFISLIILLRAFHKAKKVDKRIDYRDHGYFQCFWEVIGTFECSCFAVRLLKAQIQKAGSRYLSFVFLFWQSTPLESNYEKIVIIKISIGRRQFSSEARRERESRARLLIHNSWARLGRRAPKFGSFHGQKLDNLFLRTSNLYKLSSLSMNRSIRWHSYLATTWSYLCYPLQVYNGHSILNRDWVCGIVFGKNVDRSAAPTPDSVP